ncbi:hypothetical protein BG452_18645 [Streptomyces sp. CBMA123]|nr:hypothetical protein [Streptomyces sp. CBMA123]
MPAAEGVAEAAADGGTGEGVGEDVAEGTGAPGVSVARTSVRPSGAAATPSPPLQGPLQAEAPPSSDIPAATSSSLREVMWEAIGNLI